MRCIIKEHVKRLVLLCYTATTETGATQTMKTNHRAEPKQKIRTFSNRANQMSGTEQ